MYPCIIPGTRGPRIYMARGIFLVLLSLHGSAANCVGPADCSCHGPCHYRYGDRNYCDFRGSAIVQASHVAQYGVPESCVGQTCISCTTQTYYSVAPCCAKPPPSPPPSPLPPPSASPSPPPSSPPHVKESKLAFGPNDEHALNCKYTIGPNGIFDMENTGCAFQMASTPP